MAISNGAKATMNAITAKVIEVRTVNIRDVRSVYATERSGVCTRVLSRGATQMAHA